MQFGRLILWPSPPPPQLVQADVGHDAIQPSIETALKAESMEVLVHLQEGFLINVPGVLGALHQVESQPQHVPIIAANQFLESSAISHLRFLNQGALVEVGQRGHRGQGSFGIAGPAGIIRKSQGPVG